MHGGLGLQLGEAVGAAAVDEKRVGEAVDRRIDAYHYLPVWADARACGVTRVGGGGRTLPSS